jgi:hypothetical protein
MIFSRSNSLQGTDEGGAINNGVLDVSWELPAVEATQLIFLSGT